MKTRFCCLFIGVVLLASGVARADYTGVPIDLVVGSLGNADDDGQTRGLTAVPGYFYDSDGPGRVLTAEFTRNTFTVTFTYAAEFELIFFALDPPPPAFSAITL